MEVNNKNKNKKNKENPFPPVQPLNKKKMKLKMILANKKISRNCKINFNSNKI